MFLNPWYGGQPQGGSGVLPEPPLLSAPPSGLQPILEAIQLQLRHGWTVHYRQDGRFYYCNHATQTSSWLPPLENWDPGETLLPYGWEAAVDKEGKQYFINHLNKTTTYEDPRGKDCLEEPPTPRSVDLERDPDMGFGFVAGSEKPVIVRFVTEGGPSVNKLLPGDHILQINGEDVSKAPRDHVIQLVRSCKDKVSLIVTQPPLDNSARKSALLSAAKKQRLRANPSRVRFAESVDINGALSSYCPSNFSSSESTTPFMPNVLKAFLENGQTKSFKYDSSTTVADVLDSLHQKLGIKCPEHFALVVEHVKSLRRNKLTILDPKETLTRIAARPGAQHLRCLYRVTFVPRDAYDLLRKDPIAFEYLFVQCCNDVIQERFSPELKYDVALKLAALHIYQHSLSNNMASGKISIKTIERDGGLNRFVPASLVESMKRKELRKLLSHFLKLNSNLTAPGQKQLTALQAKLHYLKIISELPSYGAKCFSSTLLDSNSDTVILLSPKFGISQINGIQNSVPEALCDIEQVISVKASKDDDVSSRLELFLKDPDKDTLALSLEERDAEELVQVLQGYYRLLTEKPLPVVYESDRYPDDHAPPYHSHHKVQATNWNYSTANGKIETHLVDQSERFVDLTLEPPYQPPPEGYKMPNGHIPGMDESAMRCQGHPRIDSSLDANMNKTNSMYDNANESLDNSHLTNHVRSPNAASRKKVQFGGSPPPHEAKNEEVIHRAAELQQLVEDAENYLSDADGETTDVESVRSDQYGRLKHSDSLLLLTNGQRLIPNGEIPSQEAEERSGSDTDSQSTPNSSPAHRPNSMVKASDSSFGLHSPDNLPLSMESREDDIRALIRQLEDHSGLPYTFAEGTLYLDPDIIDLTMIPPPITPEEEGVKMPPPQLSTPPTPFADRETLEKELKDLERDLGDLRSLTNATWGDLHSTTNGIGPPQSAMSDSEDSLSVSSLNTSVTSTDSKDSAPSTSYSNRGSIGGPGFTLAALRQLGINLGEGEDIDSFIANLTIPPPPEGSNALQPCAQTRQMSTDYDISAFIIPPPPSNTADNRSSDIIKRLYEAKEGISKMVAEKGLVDTDVTEKDNDVEEVRVSFNAVTRNTTPGRVASLQRKFEMPTTRTGTLPPSMSSLDNRQLLLRISKDKVSPQSDSSGYDSLKSNASMANQELDVRLALALEENDKMFRALSKAKQPEEVKDVSVGTRVRAFSAGCSSRSTSTLPRPSTLQRQVTVPNSKTELRREGATPPPPPPRIPVTHMNSVSKRILAVPPSAGISKTQNSPTLSKSASQGDVRSEGRCSQKSGSKMNSSSVSAEDIPDEDSSPNSPSKQSVASSNDSLASSSSVVTVKSTSPQNLEHDNPPELPPRNGVKPTSNPPISRSSSQDNVKSLPTKGIRSPSPARKALRTPSPDATDRPPAIPSRIRKPQTSHSQATLPSTHRSRGVAKQPAPFPPSATSKPTQNGLVSPSKSPKTPHKALSPSDHKPKLPLKASQSQPLKKTSPTALKGSKGGPTTMNGSRLPKLENGVAFKNDLNQCIGPLQTSSPKASHKKKVDLDKKKVDLDDSMDSGSFDQDSLEESEEFEAMSTASRDAFRHVSSVVSESLKKLNKLLEEDTESSNKSDQAHKDESKFQEAKEKLTSDSRQFVTASKLFVKSATESEETLLQCLSNCVILLQKMVQVTQEVVQNSSTPLQTQNVVTKVRDVATTYHSTVKAALTAAGRGMDHPSMNTLMSQATNLAGVLTALMRTLRVFSP